MDELDELTAIHRVLDELTGLVARLIEASERQTALLADLLAETRAGAEALARLQRVDG